MRKQFNIFVNYRQQDSRADAGRIYDRLSKHFGNEHVFMDIDDIQPGENYIQILDYTLARCSVMLVIIGANWVNMRNDAGQLRLNDEYDFVRMEIISALERNIIVIPVLVGHAAMPRSAELPPELAILCQRQALEISDLRFHMDVDRLIAELESINGTQKTLIKINPVVRQSLVALFILSVLIGLYFKREAFLSQQSMQKQVQLHHNVGDQLLKQHDYNEAIQEYQQARKIAPDNTEAYFKITRANRDRMELTAFTGGSSLNIGLRKDYAEQFVPIDPQEISAALKIIYQLQALKPSLKNDPDLLLDEAIILKTSGLRARNAIEVLEKGKEIAPGNAAILAESGLLNAVLLQKPEGLEDIQRAIVISPDNARYHFYLARALGEIFLCPDAGNSYTGSGHKGLACANAIKAYHQAIVLAKGDVWSQHIRHYSVEGSLDIFHRYCCQDKDLLTHRLVMSTDDRIKELEFLIPLERHRSRPGKEGAPNYWLALLYEAEGQPKKAYQLISQLLEERDFQPPLLWIEYQEKLLQSIGSDKGQLTNMQILLKNQ